MGLILGIIALVLSAMPIINNFAFILGVVGLIFGIVGVVGTRNKKKSGKGMAVASVIIALWLVLLSLHLKRSIRPHSMKQAPSSTRPLAMLPKRSSAAKST